MECIYTKLALYGSKNECARTDNVFSPISVITLVFVITHLYMFVQDTERPWIQEFIAQARDKSLACSSNVQSQGIRPATISLSVTRKRAVPIKVQVHQRVKNTGG